MLHHAVCEILSKSDHSQQKKMTSCRFSRPRISAILDFSGQIMGSLKSSCTISYRSSIDTVAVNCLVFEKLAFLHFDVKVQDSGSPPSWIFRRPIMGSLKSPYTTCWSSIETIVLNCLLFEKIACLHFGDRQTDEHVHCMKPLSLLRAAA